ncbi:MAG: hypothetical protein AAFQ14_11260 [Cyanobacteria bacterium J06621_12]
MTPTWKSTFFSILALKYGHRLHECKKMSTSTLTREINVPRQKIDPADRLLKIVQTLVDEESPSSLSSIVDSLDRIEQYHPSHLEDEDDEEFLELVSDRSYSDEEKENLYFQNILNSFRLKRKLLENTVDVNQVMEIMNYSSRQAPLNRLKNNTLIAIKDNEKWQFPLWQFDVNGSQGVVEGLPLILKTLNCSNLAKVSWLSSPSPYFEGASPTQMLKAGEIDRVYDLAQMVGEV